MDTAEIRRLNRESRDELLAQIAEREAQLEEQLESDPQAAHDRLMQTMRVTPPVETRSAPTVIFKATNNSAYNAAAKPPLPLSNDDAVAAAEADAHAICDYVETVVRSEVGARLAPLQAELAELRGQVTAMLTVLGADPGRAESARKRLSDGQQLLEPPTARNHA